MNQGPTGRELVTQSAANAHLSLSQVLRALIMGAGERIRIGDLVDAFGPRAFGALLLVFAMLNTLPLPPGSSSVLSIPILIIAPQLMIGVPNLWLPRALDQRSMRRTDLRRLLDRVLPTLERAERLLAPRLHFVFGAIGDRLIGLTAFVLALILILPIPFGNFMPAVAIATLSLGLVARDGLVALIGYGIAAASVVVVVLSAHAVVTGLQRLMDLFGG